MEFHDNGSVTGINIAYIGGGSRGWAWGLMGDLAGEPRICGTVRLYDIDFEAAQHNEIIGNKYAAAENVKSIWTYKAVQTLEEAVKGTDFVVISILPGTFDEMESDVHAPEKYGIYQPVGDSTGPGGQIRAYRAIPMFAEFAEAIKKYSPEAWVLNYTNPMTLCVRALYEAFPKIKAFGCCHEVAGIKALLCLAVTNVLEEDLPGEGDIEINVQGVNHFTWVDKAVYKGFDLLPAYAKMIETVDFTDKENNWVAKKYGSHSVKFDLFKRYGVIAAAGDRHLVEFIPPWYLKNPEVVARWNYGLTSVSSRKKGLADRLEKSKVKMEQTEPFKLKFSGEQGVKQMKALLGLEPYITNVNIPNIGQITNLPLGAVVETNAYFSNNSVLPLQAGAMKWDVQILVERIIHNQETIIKAVFTKDKELGFNAFLNDPQMVISFDDARALYEEMIENTKKYIPWID
jgi:alpha-galactosidase